MVRFAPALAVLLLIGPVAGGLIGVLLPAFGWLPTLGARTPTLAPWSALLAQPGLWRSVVVSLTAGVATAAVSLALVFAFLAAFGGTRLYGWLRRVLSPLLSVPHAASAFGFAFLIAPSGLVARLLSPWATGWQQPPDLLIVHDPWGVAMMAGLVLKEVPFLLLMSLAALPQLGAEQRVAMARALGYAPVTAWFKTVAPALYPLIRLPVFAVIAFASASVDVALILGPTNPPPLSVAVVRWLNDPDLSMRFVASAGAVLQLVVTLAALAIWRGAERLVRAGTRGWLIAGRRSMGDRALAQAALAALAALVASAGCGLAFLAAASFAGPWTFPDVLPEAFTLRHWQRVLPNLVGPVVATLQIALTATAISLVLVLATLENQTREAASHGFASRNAMRMLYLPLIVPEVAFLFGLVIVVELLGLRPGFVAIVLGHIVFVLPYMYLSLAEAYRRLDPRFDRVAAALGASRARRFRAVRMPLLLAPCLTAVALGLAVSAGEYLATQLLGAGRVATVTTEAVALAAGGDRRTIGVWALMQALLPVAGFAVAIALPRLLWRNRRLMREAR